MNLSTEKNTLNDWPSMTYLLHNIGDLNNRNYNTREQVEKVDFLTFDGVYKNVYENRSVLAGKKFMMFVMGDYVGKDNSFDTVMPLEKICDWNEIMGLVNFGGLLGWHTWSHPDLRKVSDEQLKFEVTPPFYMPYFAYPYGRFDDRVIQAVKDAGYQYAFSAGKYGDGSQFQLRRKYL